MREVQEKYGDMLDGQGICFSFARGRLKLPNPSIGSVIYGVRGEEPGVDSQVVYGVNNYLGVPASYKI